MAEQIVGADAESKLISILKVLSESSDSLGSITIARRLEDEGVFLSERAVRYHLKIADERGYTRPGGRDNGGQRLRVRQQPIQTEAEEEEVESCIEEEEAPRHNDRHAEGTREGD